MIEKLQSGATCKEHLAKVNEIIDLLNEIELNNPHKILDDVLGDNDEILGTKM